MEERNQRVVEYFVVAGLKETSKTLVEEIDNSHRTIAPQDPIVELAVIHRGQGETPPQGFTCIEHTPFGFPADLNHGSLRTSPIHLCYRRGRDKPPLTDIGVLYEGKERVMAGCEIIHSTPYGRPANVNNKAPLGGHRTYITTRRASENAAHNSLAVTDICVILTNKGETPPHAFCQIDKNLNKGMVGSDVFLCYKKSMAKMNYISYKAGLIGRYPMEDYESFPLPEQVPIFCLPMGATIECWPMDAKHPLPVFSTFVLTNVDADKVYGAAVSFYESYPPEKLTEEQRKTLNYQTELDRQTKTIHTNKCISLMSHWPFFDAFRKFLTYLYRLSVSGPHAVPLERHISHFMHDVPFPSPQRPRILVQMGAVDSLLLMQPHHSPLPLSGASLTALLTNLGPDNAMNLLLFALLENKILLHSLRPAVLTSVAEALQLILFPLHWPCPYIPLCPLDLADVINAPVPFIVGVDSRYFDLYEPPQDVICVDLDTNSIRQPGDKKLINHKILPKKPAKLLRNSLVHLCNQLIEVHRQTTPDEVAVDLAPLDDGLKKQKKKLSIELAIQEAFLRFMACLLKGYRQFLLPITEKPTERATDASSLFDLQGFLRSRSTNQKFYTQIMKTQMFIGFIEECSFVSEKDTSLAFFDECMDKVDPERSDRPVEQLIDLEESFKSEHTVFVTPPEPRDLPDDRKYSYTVFPDLDHSLFLRPPNLADQFKQVSTSKPSSPMAATRRTKAELRHSQKVAKKNSGSPMLWAKLLLSHCFSLWFICLPAYVKASHSKARALRTAYDMLIKMQHACRRDHLDEVCYRVVMQLCGQHSQPVLAVKVLMEMKRNGITPNAITYGHYNKAILESRWPTGNRDGFLLWTKLRNVILAIAQFRRGIKRVVLQMSDSSDADAVSRTSVESFPDGTASHTGAEFVNDVVKLDTHDRISMGGQSDQGYSSMTKDEVRRGDSGVTSPLTDQDLNSTTSSQSSDLNAPQDKSRGKQDNSSENEDDTNGVDSDATVQEQPKFEPVDYDGPEPFRPRVSSIVRNSGSMSSISTLRGSTRKDIEGHGRPKVKVKRLISLPDGVVPIGSAAGLLITSQTSVEEPVFHERSYSLSAAFRPTRSTRKRHKSAGDPSKMKRAAGGSGGSGVERPRYPSGDSNVTLTEVLSRQGSHDSEMDGELKIDLFKGDAKLLSGLSRDDSVNQARQRIKGASRPASVGWFSDGSRSRSSSDASVMKHRKAAGAATRLKRSSGDSVMSRKQSEEDEKKKKELVRKDSWENQWDPFLNEDLDKEETDETKDDAKDESEAKCNSIGRPRIRRPSLTEASFHPLLPLDDDMDSKQEKIAKSVPSEPKGKTDRSLSLALESDMPKLFQNFDSTGTSPTSANTSPPREVVRHMHKSPSCHAKLSSAGSARSPLSSKLSESPDESGLVVAVAASLPSRAPSHNRQGSGSSFSFLKSAAASMFSPGRGTSPTSSPSMPRSMSEVTGLKDRASPSLTPVHSRQGSGSSSKLDVFKAAASAMASKFMGSSLTSRSDNMLRAPELDSLVTFDGDDSEGERTPKRSSRNLDYLSRSETHLVGTPPDMMSGSLPMPGMLNRRDSLDSHGSSRYASTQSIFHNYAMEVRMSSCMRCYSCNTLLYDEEIMAGWTPDDSNLNTECQHCKSLLVPFLNVVVTDLRGGSRQFLTPSQSIESFHSIQSAPPIHPMATVSQTSLTRTGSDLSADSLVQVGEGEVDGTAMSHSYSPARPHIKLKHSLSVDHPHSDSAPQPIHIPVDRRRCTSECVPARRESLGSSLKTGPLLSVEEEQDKSLPSSFKDQQEFLAVAAQRPQPDPITVPYLSPLVLRKEVENVLESEGDSSLTRPDFVDQHPIIYWNLVWYFRRLDVPSNLIGLVLSAEITTKAAEIPKQWLSADSKHVCVKVLWDNINLHEEPGQPLYLMWNAHAQKSSLAHALITEEKLSSKRFMQSIVTSIQSNDLLTPMKYMLQEYHKHKATQGRHRSIYREILYLSLVSLGRDNIDHDAFDREYKLAFSRLSEDLQAMTQEDDKPPSARTLWCRRIFSSLYL
ncbi:C-myc promoter-binding protein-like isoform X7 [Branchiostoma floridae x Branchiostoma japonicum]